MLMLGRAEATFVELMTADPGSGLLKILLTLGGKNFDKPLAL